MESESPFRRKFIMISATVFSVLSLAVSLFWLIRADSANTMDEDIKMIEETTGDIIETKFESTVINEVYVKGMLKKEMEIDAQIEFIEEKVKGAINQDDSVISVTRWMPGIVDEINGDGNTENIGEKLAMEAQKNLDQNSHHNEKNASQDNKNDDVLMTMEMGVTPISETGGPIASRPPRRRVRIVSTPIGGGDMFAGGGEIFQPTAPLRQRRRARTMSTPLAGDMWGEKSTVVLGPDEVLINITGRNNEKFAAKMKEEKYKLLSGGGAPILLTNVVEDRQFTGQYLDGFVRRKGSRNRSLSNTSLE